MLLVVGAALFIGNGGNGNMTLTILVILTLLAIPAMIQQKRKRKEAAEIPCPRCHEPYGWYFSWPISPKAFSCQHCGLRLDNESD